MIVQWERETEQFQDRGNNNGYHLPCWSSNDTAKQMAPSEERECHNRNGHVSAETSVQSQTQLAPNDDILCHSAAIAKGGTMTRSPLSGMG